MKLLLNVYLYTVFFCPHIKKISAYSLGADPTTDGLFFLETTSGLD